MSSLQLTLMASEVVGVGEVRKVLARMLQSLIVEGQDVAAGEWLVVSVGGTGMGAARGRGTGLGRSTSYGSVDDERSQAVRGGLRRMCARKVREIPGRRSRDDRSDSLDS
ncbi:hypothetical protein BH11MYX1_BH11MYX1_46930 [soil metagenome]